MNFKEWCLQFFGISHFSEGKIFNRVFLPAASAAPIRFDPLLAHYGAYIAKNMEGKDGLVLTKDAHSALIMHLRNQFSQDGQRPVNEAAFKKWVDDYFTGLGIDARRTQDYNNLPNMHVVISNPQMQMQFMHQFAYFYPQLGLDALTGWQTIEMPPYFLHELYRLYYQDPRASIHQVVDVDILQSHQSDIQILLEETEKLSTLKKNLDKAHVLALDRDNNIGLSFSDASTAYAASLKVYAALNKDNLSQNQHDSLMYAASLLDTRIIAGIFLTQSLTEDAKDIERLLKNYHYYADPLFETSIPKSYPTIDALNTDTSDSGQWIQGSIDRDASDLLLGRDRKKNIISREHYKIKNTRFLPDDKMQSDVDVIILQGGGRAYHSAIVRIIKVGIMPDGQPAQLGQTPHHYDYFRVENNLGAGCHEVDLRLRTCTGTFVTKIEPTETIINPFTNPLEYEKQMAATLRELITIERKLMLYRNQ